MCKAKNYSEQLLGIYSDIKHDFETLTNELSQVDLYEQDVLHMIENGKFNASDGYKFSKMIYDNRIKRREIKNELEPLQQLKTSFIDKNIQELNTSHQAVIRKDNILTNLSENKVYTSKVIGKAEKVSVPVPVTVSQQSTLAEDFRLIHKSTGREIEIIQKVGNNLYLVKYKTKKGSTQILNKKNILNFDKVKLA